MIDQIVKDPHKQIFNSLSDIKEKLDYFRALSSIGLYTFTSHQIENLKREYRRFFNIHLSMIADKYPTKLFRITNNKYIYGKSVKLQKISDLIGPPIGASNYGRCNMPGDSMFYAALDVKTAVWETQPQVGDYITLSEWKIKPGERIFTHTIFDLKSVNPTKDARIAYEAYELSMKNIYPEIKQKNKDIEVIFREVMLFLSEEYMKVVKADEKQNYLFSSLYSTMIMENDAEKHRFRVEAISYPSVKMDLGLTNIAILNSLSLKKLDLVSITLMTVGETYYDESIQNEEFMKVHPLIYKVTDFDFENDRILYNGQEELRLGIELHDKMEEQGIRI